MTKDKTIERKQERQKEKMIEQLKITPIIQVACSKCGIGRTSFYRWRKDDPKFAQATDRAIVEGLERLNDLAESKLISAIQNENVSAIRLWLQNRHPAYSPKLHITGKVGQEIELSEEDAKLLKQALLLAVPDEPKDDEEDE
ncbi:MAG: hypothetical protein COT89_01350 [Candidatus Colwellbacteria bacterium CG10_big_fil_rev_8_21_14_0_10_42_22]|uniref:Homeodomain phBC6A51-type domain-containing protein n=1 Tax=Candidatus Colwellbacteria bacterium CG10_big_fil_rev_8_21_14_0_10_42_22 TaxID=1974540 RepID=A0A2H0VG45_9BACT|nr:MAG: hypothetical protein COT89_01350 [Candidatus Colwellbacteria bacterium CG10_big_fil_rev_8_21_14_0_10_42_22]